MSEARFDGQRIVIGNRHNKYKTECKRGHPLVEGNLVKRKDTRRECLRCHRAHQKATRLRKLEARPVRMATRFRVVNGTPRLLRAA